MLLSIILHIAAAALSNCAEWEEWAKNRDSYDSYTVKQVYLMKKAQGCNRVMDSLVGYTPDTAINESGDKSKNTQDTNLSGIFGLSFGYQKSGFVAIDGGAQFWLQQFVFSSTGEIGMQYVHTDDSIAGYFRDDDGRCRENNGRFAKDEKCNPGGDLEFFGGWNNDILYQPSTIGIGGGFRLGMPITGYGVLKFSHKGDRNLLPYSITLRAGLRYFQIQAAVEK